MRMKTWILALCGATGMSACASSGAQAAGWALVPERCPDLVEDYYDRLEDRRDRRRTYSRADAREDRADARENRRDERVTRCPTSAWVWRGRGAPTARPRPVVVYFDAGQRRYFHRGAYGAPIRIVFK